jgi:hypothetical protein
MVQISRALPDSLLPDYRAAVDDLVQEAATHPLAADPAVAARLLDRRLGEPEFAMVLSYLDGGMSNAVAHLIREIRDFQPGAHSAAGDLPTFLRILLLSQIDSAWWRGTKPFISDADVHGSRDLVALEPLRAARKLNFQFRAQPAGLPGRARDWARHKLLPNVWPRVAGLRFTRSRPVVVGIVNQIARDFAAARPGTPRLWVTSMVRSVEHQHRLRALGYSAVLPSSHCAGYACDLEMRWFRRFDPDRLLEKLLLARQAVGQLNFIDEGPALHLCVSPLACAQLAATYTSQLGRR